MSDSKRAAEDFCDHFGIRPTRVDRDLLIAVGQAFARLPYENITKLLKKHAAEPGAQRRRLPAEVLRDHVSLGAGGTCFALTELFAVVLHRFGYQAWPVLCDTRHRAANHCALIVGDAQQGLMLLDPGYLLHEPVSLPQAGGPGEKMHGPTRLVLSGESGGHRVFDLHTYDTWRYRFRAAAVSPPEFEAAWDASFDWTMMDNIHLCAAHEQGYAYVHGGKLRLRDATSKQTLNIRGNEPAAVAERFGMDEDLVRRAYELVERARQAASDHAPHREGDGE